MCINERNRENKRHFNIYSRQPWHVVIVTRLKSNSKGVPYGASKGNELSTDGLKNGSQGAKHETGSEIDDLWIGYDSNSGFGSKW